MKTYRNDSASAVEVTFSVGTETRTINLDPSARLTFDETEANGNDITQACEDAGLTQV